MGQAEQEENAVKRLLGRGNFEKLVDKFLLKRLLVELYRNGRNYAEIRDNVRGRQFQVREVTTYVAPELRGGKIEITLPDKGFEMFSFYRAAFDAEKKHEIAKDYDVSAFLHERGMRVPAPVYRRRNFTATELISGSELQQVLEDNETSAAVRKQTLDMTVSEVFRYHRLEVEKGRAESRVRRRLEESKLLDFYGIDRFIGALNGRGNGKGNGKGNGSGKYVPGKEILTEDVRKRWKESIDDVLAAEKQGISHNDLHNGNIFVNGRDRQIRLIDWGDATFGPIHYDIARALISQGTFSLLYLADIQARYDALFKADAPYYDERKVFIGEISQVLPRARVEAEGYDRDKFYSSLNRAHASIRLRLARSVHAHVQKIRADEVYREHITTEEQEIMEGFASYHFTQAVYSLEREGLTDLVRDLQDLVEGSGIEKKELSWMEKFIRDHNPDVSAWGKVQAMEKRIGLIDKERKMQDDDIRKYARKRRTGKAATAVLAALGILAGGVLTYQGKVEPVQAELQEQQRVVEMLAENWESDLSSQLLVKVEYGRPVIDKDGSVRNVRTTDYKLFPNIVSHLFRPKDESEKETLAKLYAEFSATNDLPLPINDFNGCLAPSLTEEGKDKKPFKDLRKKTSFINEFFNAWGIERCSSSPLPVNSEKQLEELKEKLVAGTECLSGRSVLLQAVSPLDYYKGRNLEETVFDLDQIYFNGTGVLKSLFHTLPYSRMTQVMSSMARSNGYAGDDSRYQAHILASRLSEAIKETGSIPEGYLKMLASRDMLALADNNLREILLAPEKIPDAEDALHAYFTFMAANGIDLSTSERLDRLGVHELSKEVTLAKVISIGDAIYEGEPNKQFPTKRDISMTLIDVFKHDAAVTATYFGTIGIAVRNIQKIIQDKESELCYPSERMLELPDLIGTCIMHEWAGGPTSELRGSVTKLAEFLFKAVDQYERSGAMKTGLRCNSNHAYHAGLIEEGLYTPIALGLISTGKYLEAVRKDPLFPGSSVDVPLSNIARFEECSRRLYELQQECVRTGALPQDNLTDFVYSYQELIAMMKDFRDYMTPLGEELKRSVERQ